MPLSLDMKEKRVMSDGRRSLRDSPNSKSSCSWLMENDSDVELDRNHLDSTRPVGSENNGLITLKKVLHSPTYVPICRLEIKSDYISYLCHYT